MMEKTVASIPFFAHEAEATRLERMNRRLWILLVVLVLALIGSNLAWVLYESQFTEVVTTEEYMANAEGSGTAVAYGEGGVTIYGNSSLPQNSSCEGEAD